MDTFELKLKKKKKNAKESYTISTTLNSTRAKPIYTSYRATHS